MKVLQIVVDEVWHSGGGSRCPKCSSPSLKSLCQTHLRAARDLQRRWRDIRRSRCLCVVCNSLAPIVVGAFGQTRQGVYCPKHRNINRARCRAWMKENRQALRVQRLERIKAGLCERSEKHGPAAPGVQKCEWCIRRARRLDRYYESRAR